jgi:putative tricarboxylic transport membrane protein
MEIFSHILDGLFLILQPYYLFAVILGVAIGILVGAVPGLTSSVGIALFIPITFGMDPLFALALMAGIDNGANYGGAVPAILLRIPGTPSAVCTTFDGHPMAQKGLAGQALKIAAISSASAGMMSAMVLLLLAPYLAQVTLSFGPADFFWLCILGLSAVAVLLGKDPIKGMLSAAVGLLIATVGSDMVTGYERFTFGSLEMIEGFPLVIVLVGLFALPAAWRAIETSDGHTKNDLFAMLRGNSEFIWPWRRLCTTILKSTGIGIFFGILPGVGGTAAGFIAYNETRRGAPNPEDFGKGEPTGVAAAEAANSAANSGAMVPALTLGIPGSSSAALMIGVLIVHGLQPGPDLFVDPGGVIWGYMWAMFLASLVLLGCGGQIATRIFGQVLRLPTIILMPIIIAMTFIGAYTITQGTFHVYVMFGFGLIGYAMDRLDFPTAPLVLALVLGDKAESSLRTAMLIGQGDPMTLIARPLSVGIVVIIAFVLFFPLFRAFLDRRKSHGRESGV